MITKLQYPNVLYQGHLQTFDYVFMEGSMPIYRSDRGNRLSERTLDRLLREQKQNIVTEPMYRDLVEEVRKPR